MNIVGGRKVLVAMVMLVLCLGVVIWKGDVPAGLISVIQFLFPAFVAGNAVEHVAKAVSSRAPAPQSQAPIMDTAKLEADIQALGAVSVDIQHGVAAMNKAMALLVQRNQEYLQANQKAAAANRAAVAPYMRADGT